MACNDSYNDAASYAFDGYFVAKLASLFLVLILGLVGNTVVAICVNRRACTTGPVPSQITLLIWIVSVFGAASVTLNVVAYTVTLLAGRWPLGHSACQVYGLLSNILISGWIWLLVLASAERYKWIVDLDEYPSLFSSINTRIMIWGLQILLTITYAAPTYGWGEYSYHRGQLSVLIQVSNSSAIYHHDTESEADNKLQMSAILFDPQYAQTLLSDILRFFVEDKGVSVRSFDIIASGVLVRIRSSTRALLDCLWCEWTSGQLSADITRILVNGSVVGRYSTGDVSLQAVISSAEFLNYRQLLVSYQESSTCGLDFSNVNKHVSLFVMFALVQAVILPFLIVAYFSGKTFAYVIARDTSASTTCDDIRAAALIAVVFLLSLMAYILHQVCGILAGGVFGSGSVTAIPAWLHFFSHLTLYGSTVSLPAVYAVIFGRSSPVTCCAGGLVRLNTYRTSDKTHGQDRASRRRLLKSSTSTEVQITNL